MKLLIIPSWYPSDEYPYMGIFFKEQAQLLARHNPKWQIGISLWGSHETRLWIRIFRPLDALIRLTSRFLIKPYERLLEGNCVEFFTPAHTWTRYIRNGNMKKIIEANEINLKKFIHYFGKPDMMLAEIAYPAGWIAMKLSKKYGIPYFIREQMSPFPLPSFKHDIKKRLIPPLKKADVVLAVGSNLQAELSAFGITSTPGINFIDMDYFVPTKNTDSSGTIRIFALGRLEHQKGFDLLLDALLPLSDQSWNLRIGGAGSLQKSLIRKTKENHLASHVHFLGALDREEVKNEVQACDFFVLSSRHESFGVVLIEAMACGKPLLVTRCGGITDSLPNHVAITCEANTTSLTEGLREMMSIYSSFDPNMIRDFVLKNYDVTIAAEQFLELSNQFGEHQ